MEDNTGPNGHEQPDQDTDPDDGYIPEDSGPMMSLEERAFTRADRDGRGRVERKRAFIIAAVAVMLLAAAIVVLGPWGVFSDVLFSKAGNAGKAARERGPQGRPPGAAGAAGGRPYFWVTLKLPTSPQRYSDTRKPVVAIVVDDVGNTADKLPAWTAIEAPITFSVMPYPPLSEQLADKLHRAGYQVMMHIPTENAPPNSFSGRGQLAVGMDRNTVFQTLDSDASTVPFFSGINNHQGGRGCDDLALMTYMSDWAKSKGLYVVDSNSSAHSRVTDACLALGLPKRKNQVFIDHDNNPDYIRGSMRRLADLARRDGSAIGICHWHRPNTPTVVGEMIVQLSGEGIHFAFVKDVTN